MEYPSMISKGKKPIFEIPVNGKYILAVYEGNLSKFDILIKYRQLEKDGKWSRIRTPKHIHWTVDILIKLYQDEKNTQNFLDRLIQMWKNSKGIKNQESFKNINLENLYNSLQDDITNFATLNSKGEYSVGFLLLLAELLMIQEKTNKEDAFMFGKILEKLKSRNKELFSLISTATHNGR